MSPDEMERLIGSMGGRCATPRTTLYAAADPNLIARARKAAPLTQVIQTAPRKMLSQIDA
jgi:hypothetical protein